MTLYTIINNLCGISSLTALLESSDLYKSKTPPMGAHKINYSSIVAHDIVYVNPRTGQEKRVRVTRGRLSWRQVNDYLELRSQQ